MLKLLGFFLFKIGLNIKVQKQYNKREHVTDNHSVQPIWKVAVDEEVVRAMNQNQHELNLSKINSIRVPFDIKSKTRFQKKAQN